MSIKTDVKKIVVYYRIPPESHKDSIEIKKDINNVKINSHKIGLIPTNTYIDKSISGSMLPLAMNFATNPDNKISAIVCMTAGNNLADLNFYDYVNPKHKTNNIKKHYIGAVPFGYFIDVDGALKIDYEKSQVIKELFNKRASGYSLQSLVDMLAVRKIKSARGRKWSKAGIAYLLSNRIYAFGSNDNSKNSNKAPPIISKTLFNEINGLS